jgi:hypothetical protein
MTKHLATPDKVERSRHRFVSAGLLIAIVVAIIMLFIGIISGILLQRYTQITSPLLAKPTTVTSATLYKVGEKIVMPTYEETVTDVKFDSVGGHALKPSSGNQYVILTLKFKNLSNTSLVFSPMDQTYVTDDASNVHTITIAEVNGLFRNSNVAPGDSIAGTVVYEVPISTKHPVLHFDPSWMTSPPVSVGL